jgi:hypothetical protein
MSSTDDAATLQALLAKKAEVHKKQEEEECWEEEDLQRQLEEVRACENHWQEEEAEWKKKVEAEKKRLEAAKRKAAEKKCKQEEKAVREVEEKSKRVKRKQVEDEEDEEKEDEEEDEDEEKHYLVLDLPCKRCKERQEQCMKEVGGKDTSCVQCIKIKKMCEWVDKGKGKEVKKRVVKKVRSEFKAGLLGVCDDEDGIKDNNKNLMAVLWVVVDALHNIQVDN